MANRRDDREEGTPAIEWVAAFVGAGFAFLIVGFVAWEGFFAVKAPPDIRVELGRRHALATGVAIDFEALNEGGEPAADVLIAAGEADNESRVVFDFLPGHSRRKGTFLFAAEPAARLNVRVLGYRDP